MSLTKKVAIGFGCVFFLLFIFSRLPPHQYAQSTQDAEAAIRLLSSADVIERLEARRKLLELGSHAVAPLLAYLDDLIRQPYERFPIGREQEGEAALQRYNEKTASGEEVDPDEKRKLMSLIVTSRLKNDVISVLGELHAAEAITLLIEAMWEEESFGATEQMNSAMQALKAIGAEAVPGLIEAIESADEKVSSVRRGGSEVSRGIDIFRLQARGAMVLGQIGDQQALPSLERLLKRPHNKFILPYVEAAIAEIKKRNGAEALPRNQRAHTDG